MGCKRITCLLNDERDDKKRSPKDIESKSVCICGAANPWRVVYNLKDTVHGIVEFNQFCLFL